MVVLWNVLHNDFRNTQDLQNEVAKGDANPPVEETKEEKSSLQETQIVPSTYAAGGNQEMSDELLAGGNQNLANEEAAAEFDDKVLNAEETEKALKKLQNMTGGGKKQNVIANHANPKNL